MKYLGFMTHTGAVIYVRISKDSEGLGLGVARQLEDARTLAQARGWTVVAEYEDNDVSAAGGVSRSGFEAVLKALTDDRATVVIAWTLDRLTRNRRDSVRLIETAQEAKAVISLCRGADMDMSTPAGRMTADILASVARAEIETKSDRQQRAMIQRAQQGRKWWSNRPFGYNMDGTPHEVEAPYVKAGYLTLLEGGTCADIHRAWNTAGVLTTLGKAWHPVQISTLFKSPRNAGLRTYKGEELGEGEWTPLVAVDIYRAVNTILTDPSRTHGGSREPKYLLTGIAECGTCLDGSTVNSHHGRNQLLGYRCYAKPHNTRKMLEIDAFVVQRTLSLLIKPESVALLKEPEDLQALRIEAAAIRQELTDLATAHGARQITLSQMIAASEGLSTSLADLEAQISASTRSDVFEGLVRFQYASDDAYGEALAAWNSLSNLQQKEVIRSVWARIVLMPVKPNAKTPLIETVRMVSHDLLAQVPDVGLNPPWSASATR